MAIYLIKKDGEPAMLVKAATKNAAIRTAVSQQYTAEAVTAEEALNAINSGINYSRPDKSDDKVNIMPIATKTEVDSYDKHEEYLTEEVNHG